MRSVVLVSMHGPQRHSLRFPGLLLEPKWLLILDADVNQSTLYAVLQRLHDSNNLKAVCVCVRNQELTSVQ
jgi:hypothetical protein